MEHISYLPKFFDRADLKNKSVELNAARKWLKDQGKLSKKELELLDDVVGGWRLYKGAYSKNNCIREVNMMITFTKSR